MPYRRLPNTDISRIKALNNAIDKSSTLDYKDVAIKAKTLSEAKSIVNKFELLISKYQETFDTQVKANISFQGKVKNARLYISHFIQVLYMSVIRNEIKTEQLEYYGLHKQELILPDLSTNDSLMEWGARVVEGEQKRIQLGGVPIYNPGIAKVIVMYTQFKEAFHIQQIHKNATNRILKEVSIYRDEVDSIILEIWNEVERHNSSLNIDTRLDKNREYGLNYYFRKGEILKNEND